MKRAYAKRGAGHKRKPSERRAPKPDTGREVHLPLDREELLGLMQDSLEGLAAPEALFSDLRLTGSQCSFSLWPA